MIAFSARRVSLAGALVFLALLGLGLVLPKWLIFLSTIALSNGLVSLGIVLMMRCGAVPFGQGLVFAAGGYAAALLFNRLGITDVLVEGTR